ncbi:Slp family lipoprotein [Vibrio genomosp. F10]|uniref:Slp family lipoprotein n=1 Tax=Vibrio genomosp. F10 TaxID=723171 RepID=UPI000A787F65
MNLLFSRSFLSSFSVSFSVLLPRVRVVIIFVTMLLLSACSTLPESLSTAPEEVVISDYSVWMNAEPQTGQFVRLGGVIASTTNLANKTRIEVVNLPINSSGKPDINQAPNGRFVGYIDGYVEPLAYQKGQLITVLGQSDSNEKIMVGEFEQVVPIMSVTGHHLWKIQERVVIDEVRISPYSCLGLHCRQVEFSPRHGRVIQEVR